MHTQCLKCCIGLYFPFELSFYTAMPLTLCCTCAPNVFKFGTSEVTEFIVKDRSSMQAIEFDWWDFVNPFSKLGWCQWIGAAIFLCGWIHQHRCHAILVSITVSLSVTGQMAISLLLKKKKGKQINCLFFWQNLSKTLCL
jgi:3-oxo-5-alpha-steroid 4-dehydrogenase 3